MQLSRRRLEGSRRQAAPHIFALRAAHVGNGTAARHGGNAFCLVEDGRFGTGGDAAALMEGQRAERAPAPAAAMGGDARGDHFHRRDRFLVREEGCGRRENGRAYRPSSSSVVRGAAGGMRRTVRSPLGCARMRRDWWVSRSSRTVPSR